MQASMTSRGELQAQGRSGHIHPYAEGKKPNGSKLLETQEVKENRQSIVLRRWILKNK